MGRCLCIRKGKSLSWLELPVDSVLARIHESLEQHPNLILTAPPGSGKTTRVAPYLVDRLSCLIGKQTYLLQPRRVAAKACALRIAEEHQWDIGKKIGYSVRFDTKRQDATQLMVCTEGVLLRQLQQDPLLEQVGLVVLDEFHERSILADLLLGMLKRVQSTFRPDLRIVVMSATIDSSVLRQYLDDAVCMETDGRMFPVDILYRPVRSQQHWLDHLIETVELTCEREEGDILVFLPGAGEIQRCKEALNRKSALRHWDVVPLHGSLPLEEQSRAIYRGDKPRVVLSTNVAETSLTIEGIQIVIDSGLARVMRMDPTVGLDRLEMEPICQASADQRAGRAGRVQAGKCIRLWDERSTATRPRYLDPEIRRVDLSGPLLQLMAWGEGDGRDFPWLLPPREDSVAMAVRLLARLGCHESNRLTPMGKMMASLPLAPRLARLLIEGHRRGQLEPLAWVAAMLSERDPFIRNTSSPRTQRGPATSSQHRWDSDVVERWGALERYRLQGETETPFGEIHRNAMRNLSDTVRQLVQETEEAMGRCGEPFQKAEEAICQSLLLGYPDRLAKRRMPGKPKGLMVGGKGVQIGPQSGVLDADLFLCIDVDGGAIDAMVRQASGVEEAWLPASLVRSENESFYHPTQKQLVARKRKYFDDLMLSETPASLELNEQAAVVLFDALQGDVHAVAPGAGTSFESWKQRVECLRAWMPELELPMLDESFLRRVLKQLCLGRKSLEEVRSAPWMDWIRSELNSNQWEAIEQEAPERIRVPSGNWIKIEYESGKPPILSVRIQEVFSWKATPRIAKGRVPLLMHLLAPNMRPQQVTDDLASFWNSTYQVVRKELKRRYPKHHWPEDPWTASPCSGVMRKNQE